MAMTNQNHKTRNSDRSLLLFFGLTFLWTWGVGLLPVILGLTGTGIGTFLFYFCGGAPSVVALFIVFLTYSKEQRKDYFYRCFSFRYMGWKWPLITICVFASISFLCVLLGVRVLGYEMPSMNFLHAIIRNPLFLPLVLLISLISGPLNEEFGWRGFALDRLLVRFGFVKGSLILGFFWAIWHLPWYFMPDQAQYQMLQDSVFHAVMYIPSTMLLSVWVSFVYVKTGRSILAGALVHMFSNLFMGQLLSPYTTEMSLLIRYSKMVFFAGILLYTVFSQKFKKEVAELLLTIS